MQNGKKYTAVTLDGFTARLSLVAKIGATGNNLKKKQTNIFTGLTARKKKSQSLQNQNDIRYCSPGYLITDILGKNI